MREHDIVVGEVIVKSEEDVNALELRQTGLPHPVGITRLFCLGGYGIFLSCRTLVCTACQRSSQRVMYGDPKRPEYE